MDAQHPAPRVCHAEGLTDICYSANGTCVRRTLHRTPALRALCSKLVTCGADNSVRIFSGYGDEDAVNADHHQDPVTCVAALARAD